MKLNCPNCAAPIESDICPYCKEIFTTIEIPGGLPYVCELLWPISAKEKE